jgi:hypothetical protein
MRRGTRDQAFRWCIGAWICLNLWQAAAVGAYGADDFAVVNSPVEIPERGKVTGYCIIADGFQFSFIPPLDWRPESNRTERSMTFTRRALDTAIRIRLLPAEVEAKEPDEARWREMIKARYPEAEIVRQFACHTGTRSGVAFDLRQDFGPDLLLESRVAMVFYGKGIVEIAQMGLKGTVKTGHEDFGALLTSLRIEAQKKEGK